MQSSPEKEGESQDEKSSLPGVTGALVNAANSKLATSLLGRMFNAYGDYWGELAEERVAKKREKRRQNAYAMVERVAEIEGEPQSFENATEEEEQLQFEWTIGAEKVDPKEQPELAELWQGLLGRIFRRQHDTAEIVSTLSQLNSSDAQLLLNMPNLPHYPEPYSSIRYQKLERLSIVHHISWNSVLSPRFLMAAVGIIVAMPLATSAAYFYLRVLPEALREFFPYSGILIVMVMSIPVVRHVGTYCLTQLGDDLRRSGE